MIHNLTLAISYSIIGFGAHAVYLQAKGNDPLSSTILPPCFTESDDNCYWDDKLMADGLGWSYVRIEGTYIYLEPLEGKE